MINNKIEQNKRTWVNMKSQENIKGSEGKNWPRRVASGRRQACRMIVYAGLAAIGILAIPTAIMAGAIYVVWIVTDKAVKCMNR
ncbi:MAG: hypothetical protein Q4C50_11885 [Eubacteriales bacterium]|nr:hypothetical protein [Eubacteriales bacterium]